MVKRSIILLITCVLISLNIQAQTQDPVLFTVEENPVNLSEFKYIYSKTNGEKADFSKASLQEYLDLYVRFKLKVQKAREMKLDTIPTLINELEGYRKQLANSYLVDKQVTEMLVKEAYERMQKDVLVSHIMVAVKPNTPAKDTLSAYNKIQQAYKMLESGKTFKSVTADFSEDKATSKNGGQLGYLTALLPNGFYEMENAAYSTSVRKYSKPFRTAVGYHIIKVSDIRPARGQMEAAHILIRIDPKKNMTDTKAKTRIMDIIKEYEEGASFEDLAAKYSEDKKTSERGGNIGVFGINRYERDFENAAFGLEKDGQVSEPVKTSVGWHLIKRIAKNEMADYEIEKRRLQAKIQNNGRYAIAKSAMINRLKQENNFKDLGNFEKFTKELTPDFLTQKWRPNIKDKAKMQMPLFSIGGQETATLSEYEAYAQRAARQRLRAARDSKAANVAKDLYNGFIDEKLTQYEEKQLEAKYPEFKALMREYREGILLFEATKLEVWDKASQDSVGLKAFHEKNADNFKWDERAVLSIYTISPEANKKALKKINKFVKKKDAAGVQSKLGKYKGQIAVQEKVVEKGKDPILEKVDWKKGATSGMIVNEKNNSKKLIKVEKILPSMNKTMKEARGYIIAAYQDYLEKEWIKSLEDKYDVEINQSVFNSMIR